jgi:DNA repair protein RadD
MSSTDVKGEVHLRPYQESAIARVRALVRGGARRILVVASTGAGKTVCFAHISAAAAHRGNSVLIIAHRRELIHQTYRKLCEAGLPEAMVGVLMATDARRRPTAPVQVASVDTLRYRPKPAAHIVIVDEAHRELAKSYADVRALYPDALHLGFTATPFRADNRGLGEFYEELVVVASVRELIDQGYLVEPRVFTVPEGELPDLRGVRTRGGDYDQGALGIAVDQQRLVGNIVEHWQKHAAGVRTVAFAVSVVHSKHIVERFVQAGVSSEHLDGATPTHERDAILARLDRGETLVVSNCSVLAEGWDQPSVKCAILARPTKSTGLYLQQAGRILRPWNDTRAVILDHAGCAREHGLPQDDREYSLESKPRQKRTLCIDLSRTCENCLAVLPIQTRTCPECGHVLAPEREAPNEIAGDLVEAKVGENLSTRGRRESPFQRAAYEQLRALARAKKKDDAWVAAAYASRYGAAPLPKWAENGWGSL